MKIQKIMLAAVAALFAMTANADPIEMDVEYDLSSHDDGGAAEPFYGLRLDGLLTGNSGHIYTFDFDGEGAEMHMVWTDDGLRIYGTAYGGRDVGDSYSNAVVWTIEFTYSNAGQTSCGSTGLCWQVGEGTISSSQGSFDLVAYTGSHDYAFRLDYNHRGNVGVSGWGWLNHCPSVPGTETDDGYVSTPGGDCDNHLYASDWLFKVNTVPEPGTLLLMGLGLLGIGMSRRKKV